MLDQVPLAWTAEPVPTNVPTQVMVVPLEFTPNVADPELETVPTTGAPALLEICPFRTVMGRGPLFTGEVVGGPSGKVQIIEPL